MSARCLAFALAWWAVTAAAEDDGPRHVPPDPPTLVLEHMTNERMIELMQMDDDASFWSVQFDEIETFRREGEQIIGWDAGVWLGTDYHKLRLKSAGKHRDGETRMRAELRWDRIVSPWWSLQAGVRHDALAGPSRTWAAFGVQGLAPYFVAVEAMLYVGEGGRTAARIEAQTDWLLTQRLILQPKLEIDAYGKDDRTNGIGSGVSSLELGLRLRYEIVREIAPYVGVQWERAFGATADLLSVAGGDPSEVVFVAGIKAWF